MPTSATLASLPNALVLVIDDPARDDLEWVKVWASTTNGFTPDSANLVSTSRSLTHFLPNLTPLVTWYVKFAFVSSIDVDDFDYSAQFSAVPSKIDGTLVADAFRGKKLIGGFFADEGTQMTVLRNPPGSPSTTVTLNVEDTTDFLAAGTAIILSAASNTHQYVRYTGKTATTFTGVQGLVGKAAPGDLVLPIITPLVAFQSYSSGSLNFNRLTGDFYQGYPFIASGTAIAFNGHTTDSFAFTSSDESGLGGLTGLAARPQLSDYSPQFVAGNASSLPLVALSAGIVSTIDVGGASSLFSSRGGEFWAVPSTLDYFLKGKYFGKSGNVISVASLLNDSFNVSGADNYYIIPISKGVVIGAGYSVFTYDNFGGVYHGPDQSFIKKIEIRNANGEIPFQAKAYSALPAVYGESAHGWPYMAKVREDLPSNSLSSGGPFGVYHDLTLGTGFFVFESPFAANNPGVNFLQTSGVVHYFSSPLAGAGLDSIRFNAATITYSFNANAGDANAHIAAGNASIGGSLYIGQAVAVAVTSLTPVTGGSTALGSTASQFHMNHTATIASHTLTLPLSANVRDGHEITVAARAAVTALTIAGNGSTVRGAPTTIAANGFFTLRWSVVSNCWYRCN